MTLKQIFYFGNGNYVSFDKKGKQVVEENGNAFLNDLRSKLERGVVNEKTKISLEGWEGVRTVKDVMNHLKEEA